MNKILLSLAISLSLLSLVLIWKDKEVPVSLGEAVTRYMNIPTVASSTSFALTTASQRLLATTSSPNNRVAATVRLAGCTSSGSRVHLNIRDDVAATTATGPVLSASSTESVNFGVYSLPVNNGAVTGITNTGTCTVIVTEWVALR